MQMRKQGQNMIKPIYQILFLVKLVHVTEYFIKLYQLIQSRVIKKSEQNLRPYDIAIMSSGRYDVVMKV